MIFVTRWASTGIFHWIMGLGSDAFFKAALDTILDGVIIIDARGRIRYVNPALVRLFGYDDADELTGQSMNVLVPSGKDRENHDKHLDSYLRTGRARVIGKGREVAAQRKDGTVFPIWLSVNEYQFDGQRFMVGVLNDFTEQKKTEKTLAGLARELDQSLTQRTKELAGTVNRLLKINLQLKKEIREKEATAIALKNSQETLKLALQKERHLNEMKSRFLSMASHEFKTPLSAILSSASILERYTEAHQQDKRVKHIAKIKRMIRQLNDVLNDFLSVERLDGREIPLRYTDVNLKAFLKTLVEEADMLKIGQKIVLKYRAATQVLHTDSNILRMIIRNLLSNAVKYSDEGTKIQLIVGERGGYLEIKVKDEGIGIPESEQKYIFTRFFRSTNAAHIKGTGLGLAIVKRYVEALNGQVSFKSTVGKGSVFIIKLPLDGGEKKEKSSGH